MLSFWISIISTDCKKLSSRVYRLARRDGVGQWCTFIRKLCVRYGLLDMWNSNTVAGDTVVSVTKRMKQYVWTQVMCNLHDGMTGGKADFYMHLMPDIPGKGVSSWYLSNLSDKNCKTLSSFRMRCHGLVIDIGAWHGLERSERLCSVCEVVDDESHFLFECSIVSDLRLRYINYNRRHGDDRDTYGLLNTKDKRTLDNVAVFIRKGLKHIDSYYKSLDEAGLLVWVPPGGGH